MLTRRDVVVAGALLILSIDGKASCCRAQSARAPRSRGCHLADADLDAIYPVGKATARFVSGDEPVIDKSGDADFDLALAQTLAKISDRLGVIPGFAYYDDSDSMNAYASPRVRLSNADGTVLMGINLLRTLRAMHDAPDVAVAGVCSHEFGHILQFKHGLDVDADQPTVKRSELQADYFAGYFAGLRKRERASYPAAVVALIQHDYGDTAFWNPAHHGTPEERGAAVVKGFEAAFRDNKAISDAIQESTSYVSTL